MRVCNILAANQHESVRNEIKKERMAQLISGCCLRENDTLNTEWTDIFDREFAIIDCKPPIANIIHPLYIWAKNVNDHGSMTFSSVSKSNLKITGEEIKAKTDTKAINEKDMWYAKEYDAEEDENMMLKLTGLKASGLMNPDPLQKSDVVDIYKRNEVKRMYGIMKRRYNKWTKLRNPEKSTLAIKGSPGAGKTMIAYIMAIELMLEKKLETTIVWVSLFEEGEANIVISPPFSDSLICLKIVKTESITDYISSIKTPLVIFLDGMRSGNLENEDHRELRKEARGKIALTYLIMSGSTTAESKGNEPIMDNVLLSWKEEEARAAWKLLKMDNNEIGKECSFDEKYFLAGGSARLLFRTKIADVIVVFGKELRKINLPLGSLLVDSIGQESSSMSNLVVAPYYFNEEMPVYGHSSGYILAKLRNKVREGQPEMVYEQVVKLLEGVMKNPCVNGFVWEGCIDELVAYKIYQDITKPNQATPHLPRQVQQCVPFGGEMATPSKRGLKVCKRYEYPRQKEVEKILADLSVAEVENGVWLAPEAWNNALWDFVYLEGNKMTFIQCTIAKSHSIKEQKMFDFVKEYNNQIVQKHTGEDRKEIEAIAFEIWYKKGQKKTVLNEKDLITGEEGNRVGPYEDVQGRNGKIQRQRKQILSIAHTGEKYGNLTEDKRFQFVQIDI